MDTLPVEMLQYIFADSSPLDIWHVMLTCHHLWSALYCEKIWKAKLSLFVKNCTVSYQQVSDIMRATMMFYAHVRELKYQTCATSSSLRTTHITRRTTYDTMIHATGMFAAVGVQGQKFVPLHPNDCIATNVDQYDYILFIAESSKCYWNAMGYDLQIDTDFYIQIINHALNNNMRFRLPIVHTNAAYAVYIARYIATIKTRVRIKDNMICNSVISRKLHSL